MNRFVFSVALLSSLLIFATCASNNQAAVHEETQSGSKNQPVENTSTHKIDSLQKQKEQKTLAAACKAAGFTVSAPASIQGLDAKTFFSRENESVEIVYSAKNAKDRIRIKKSLGNLDTSEDSTHYPNTRSLNDRGTDILLRSTESLFLATWISGDYSFCISVSGPNSLVSQEEMLALVQKVY